jgi:Tol biopolymer transport system component
LRLSRRPEPARSEKPKPLPWSKIAATAGGLVLAALVAYLLWPGPAPLRFTERPLTSDVGSERLPSLSPDGTRAAYSWWDRGSGPSDSDIYVRLVDIPSSQALPVTEDPESSDWWPAWSPDGTQIAFIREEDPEAPFPSRHGLYHLTVAPASGGSAQRLFSFAARANFYTKPDWSPDGKHIVFAGQLDPDQPTSSNRILLYSFDSKTAKALTADPGGAGFHHPVFSPDGRRLAFRGGFDQRGWYTLALDDCCEPRGEPSLVAPGVWWGLEWSPDGEDLYFLSQGDEPGLYRMAASGQAPPKFLWPAESLELSIAPGPSGGLRAAVAVESGDLDIVRASLPDPNAAPEPLIQSSRMERHAQYSPDGTQIAFLSDRYGQPGIWIRDHDGRDRELTKMNANGGGFPVWSPDGDWIAFHQLTSNGYEVFVVEADGSGRPRPLARGRRPAWSSDSSWIYFRSAPDAESDSGGVAIWRVHIEGGEPEQVAWPVPGMKMGQTMESLDGRTLYADYNEGLLEIPLGEDGLAGSELEVVANDVRGFSVVESGVYYCTTSGVVKRYDPVSGATESLRRLEDQVGDCSVSPDGQWLLYTRQIRSGHDLMLLESVE